MTDWTEHGAEPVEDAAVPDPPTVHEVRARQEHSHPEQARTAFGAEGPGKSGGNADEFVRRTEESAMGRSVRDLMTTDPIKLGVDESVTSAARAMRDNDIGDVLVTEDGHDLVGIVTDRDIVVRGLADIGSGDGSIDEVTVGSICSDVITVSPDDSVDEVVDVMREQAVRRIPVVENEMVIGMVSLGDLAAELDPDSVLGEISDAPENN